MIIDSEEHRAFLISAINAIEIPGRHIELAFAVKQAVQKAEIAEQKPPIDLSRVSDDT